MRENLSSRLEWVGGIIHSYTEEVRTAALSYLGNISEDLRDEAFELICESIRDQIAEVDRFSNRVGDVSYKDILDFKEVRESDIKREYLHVITNLCTEYKRAIMSYISQMPQTKKMEEIPSLTISILVLIADFRYKIQALREQI